MKFCWAVLEDLRWQTVLDIFVVHWSCVIAWNKMKMKFFVIFHVYFTCPCSWHDIENIQNIVDSRWASEHQKKKQKVNFMKYPQLKLASQTAGFSSETYRLTQMIQEVILLWPNNDSRDRGRKQGPKPMDYPGLHSSEYFSKDNQFSWTATGIFQLWYSSIIKLKSCNWFHLEEPFSLLCRRFILDSPHLRTSLQRWLS